MAIHFYKGKENVIDGTSEEEGLAKIKDSFSKVLDGKNLSFLLGSGCSSHYVGGSEVGIPTMRVLCTEFYTRIDAKKVWIKDNLHIDVAVGEFSKNLEYFLGVIQGLQYYYTCVKDNLNATEEAILTEIVGITREAKEFLVEKCLNEVGTSAGTDAPLMELYIKFYRKLLYRNNNLQKPNVFTTNYDLYSERALDQLGVLYVNGFSGGIKRYFNPTVFNYAFAEKMDLSQNKWNVIDNFVYLYKIHGSINWVEDDSGSKLFKVREIQDVDKARLLASGTLMVYPTPLKQNASLGSPYSDLFREFQKKLMQNNNVLVTLGYSFSDEHVNNLIYQAFTIPSFRLIIIGAPDSSTEIKKLLDLDDPRIWVLHGEVSGGKKLHYFEGFIENVLPDLTNDEIDDKIEKAIINLINSRKP